MCVGVSLCTVCVCIITTSVHDSSGVHMFERTAELDKVLPHCSLWDKPPLLLKVLLSKCKHTHMHRGTDTENKVILAYLREGKHKIFSQEFEKVLCGTEYNFRLVAKCLCLHVFIQHPSPASVPSSVTPLNATQTTLLLVGPLPNQAPSHFLYGLQ